MNTLRLSSSRLSALLRVGVLAVVLALPHGGAWAQQGPLTTSPPAPTPFSWSTFHSGGANPTAVTLPSLLPPNPLVPNPRASQLQGTPTGVYTGSTGSYATEIPSFLIGNYDFATPPAGVDGTGNITFFPNHFADDLAPGTGGYLSWSAPFTFLAASGQTTSAIPSLGHSSIVADDSQTTARTYQVYNGGTTPPTPASGVDAGWTVQWAASSATTWTPQITDVTASGDPSLPNNGTDTTTTPPTIGQEYVRQAAVSAPIGTKSASAAGYATSTWTFTAPAPFSLPAQAGLYSLVFHLPDPQVKTLADGTANLNYPERRINDAHYVVTLLHAGVTTTVFDTDTLDKNGSIVRRAAISQTETNDPQPLAGPFALSAGDVLTVTLDNTTTLPITDATNTYVLADSVSLVPTASAGGSARMDGSPTAINATDFPEIANALFYGFAVTPATATTPATQVDDNTQPFGNKTIGTADTSTAGLQHAIRQLVYFGRYEGIVLTNEQGQLVGVDGKTTDSAGATITTPVTRMVGAIYCVDGINGDVVWRFQTSDVLNPNGTIARPSAAVYTTPAIARINVLVNGVVETKLCVVAADDNGLVYCLDAIGNRNGTNNSTAVDATYNQPIYSPGAALKTDNTQDTNPHAHVGNTTAYWVYRPDAARPRLLNSTATPPQTKAIDRTSDLPVPAAFGLASPTIYVNPNTAIDTTTTVPGAAAPAATLTPNGIVYIGNSNGTLYKLDATGAAVTETTPTTAAKPGSGIFYSTAETYNYVLPISLGGLNPAPSASFTPLPTPTVGWWFAVNKGATNDTTQTGNVAITSAPSIYQPGFANAGVGVNAEPPHYVYFGTSNENTNVGNVFSVLDTGPVTYSTTGASTGLTVGGTNYNLLARPDWSFPNAYTNTKTGTAIIHAALGSISGSPVVFTNPDTANSTSVYFAANQGPEGYQAERPAPAESGRIWAVDATLGTTQWAYPDTVDPNKDNTAAGSATTIGGTTVTQALIDALPTLGTFRNASPAIGIVQFPAVIGYGTAGTTGYVHTDAVNTTNVVSARVPMLYVGSRTEAPDSSNFFALDLDGTNDDERNIHFIKNVNNTTTNIAPVGNTYGPGFESSPLLVTNSGPSTGTVSGNGGVVFIAASDNTLNELSATPTIDIGTDSTGPMYTNFAKIGGFGAFASPAIAGFTNTGLTNNNTGANAGIPTAFVDTDWVYGGDSTLGIARGITPGNRNGSSGSGGIVDFGSGGTGPDIVPPSTNPQQFPLHVYLFDNTGTPKHDPTSTDMSKANPIATSANPNPGPIAAFEWGDKLYIRVSNVVPPNPPTTANPAGNTALYMADPTDKSVYYTNGGPIQVQLSDIDANGQIVVGGGADHATVNTNILASLTDPNGNGFIKENPSGSGAQDNIGDMLTDNLGTGVMWLGAATYPIGNGTGRKNTPGSRRQIITATQTVEAHNAADGKFLSPVTLSVGVNSSPNSFRRGRKIIRIPKVDQPTFAVLNPLAVRGGGPNIPLGNSAVVKQIDNVVGPFAGINTTTPSGNDLAAYVNGNNVYVSAADVPKSGVLEGDKGQKRRMQVTVATTDIPHGSIGNNSNPAPTATGYSGPSTQGNNELGQGTNIDFGNYAFDVADRSDLGLNGNQINNLTIQTAPASWNDNTGSQTGAGAVVNPLPWDDAPTAFRAGNNGSVDYPNIGKQRIAHTLYNNNSTSGTSVSDNGAALDPTPSAAGTTPANRQVQPDNIRVEVSVPKYQPANLQLYEQPPTTIPNGRISPAGLTSSTQTVYPMGYVAHEYVYVNGTPARPFNPGDGRAFRSFRVITGVPVDMTMTVADPTIDLGKLPQTFGVQTDTFLPTVGPLKPLGPFMPFQSAALAAVAGAGYQQYFKPIVAHNEGNINLLNVHFDQKLLKYTAAGGGATNLSALPFGSDALDAQAILNAFDLNGVTGPDPNTGAPKYILRTSLDSDLAPYNRNPYLAAQNGIAYPNATFHKARVSDTNPPTLTVPDVPHDNAGPYSLLVGSALTPKTFGPPALDATTNRPTSYGMPYIGLAVPLGTPVGNYAQDVRLFEGIDPYAKPTTPGAPGYPDIQATGSYLYKPLFPPVYGGVVADGTTAPAGSTTDMLTTLGSAVTQPYSNPIRVRASIVETRVTDGATYGNLPQVDAGPITIPAAGNRPAVQGAADFLPFAFRSTFWNGGTAAGNSALNLYWTSASPRPAVANAPPYTLIGAHAPFNKAGYFQADTTTGSWYDQIANVAVPTAGFNTAISIAPDQHLLTGNNFSSDGTAYAFVQNVVAASGTTPYQNNLYCYSVNTTTGGITGTAVPISTDTRQPKFGARGLKYNAATVGFKDALAPNAAINDNLWAFWNSGTRGRSTLSYSSALSASVDAYTSGATPFTAAAQALPTPAGLSGVSDPSAVLTSTTLTNNATVPAIDVTYSGVNADGNTDVYVSRYLPYNVRKANGTTVLTDANGKNVVGLALTPSPAITEQLLPDTARQFYQARDVAWARADTLDVQVNNVHLLQDVSKTQNADGSYPLFAGIRTSYDRASGTAVYTIPNSPVNGNSFATTGGTLRITTIYVDLVRGRVRFRTSYTGAVGTRFDVPLPDGLPVTASFQPQARRITVDRRADTEPVSFIDEAYKNNEANFYNVGLRAQGAAITNPDVARVSTARYWFLWRKSAAPGTTTTPTLYSKTQRLTVYLHGSISPYSPVPIKLNANNQPIVTVTDTTTGTVLYDAAAPGSAQVDVDWARGRLYFPLRDSSGHALEGDNVSVTFTPAGGASITQPINTILWLDELRYNDPAAQPTGDPATTVDTNEHAVPIDVAANEGSPSAFLDPLAYADVAGGAYDPFSTAGGFTNPTTMLPNPDQPHKVWLFWNSTRSGTADVYYETIDPRFSANP